MKTWKKNWLISSLPLGRLDQDARTTHSVQLSFTYVTIFTIKLSLGGGREIEQKGLFSFYQKPLAWKLAVGEISHLIKYSIFSEVKG